MKKRISKHNPDEIKPSLTISLFEDGFVLNQQPSKFAYNRSTKDFLELIENQRLHPDFLQILEEIPGVVFYDGLLIAEILDHRIDENQPSRRLISLKPSADSVIYDSENISKSSFGQSKEQSDVLESSIAIEQRILLKSHVNLSLDPSPSVFHWNTKFQEHCRKSTTRNLSEAIQLRKKTKTYHQTSEELERSKLDVPMEDVKPPIPVPAHIAARLPTEKQSHFNHLLETIEKYGMFRPKSSESSQPKAALGCMPYSHGSTLSFNAFIHQYLNLQLQQSSKGKDKDVKKQKTMSPLDITFGTNEAEQPPSNPLVYGLINRRMRFHGQSGKIFCALHIYPKGNMTEFEALIRVGKSPDNGTNGDTVKINIGNCTEGLAFVDQVKHSFEKDIGMLVYDSMVQPNLPPLPAMLSNISIVPPPAPAPPSAPAPQPSQPPSMAPTTIAPSIPNPQPPVAPSTPVMSPAMPMNTPQPVPTAAPTYTGPTPMVTEMTSISPNISLPPSMHGLLKKEFGANTNITVTHIQKQTALPTKKMGTPSMQVTIGSNLQPHDMHGTGAPVMGPTQGGGVAPYQFGQPPVHMNPTGFPNYGNRPPQPSAHLATGMANGTPVPVANPQYTKMTTPVPKPFTTAPAPFVTGGGPPVPNPSPTNPLLRVGGDVPPANAAPRLYNWMNNGTKPNPSVKQ